jgi:phage baseplate assembly protein W
MSEPTNEVFYRDFDLKFIAHPITGKLILKKNSESVKQAVKNLILTNLSERPYRPLYGSSIRGQLFELFTPMTEDNIRSAIRVALNNYEPRVELLDIRFGGDPDRNSLEIAIVFRPVNSVSPEVLTINLERIR